MAMTFVKGNGLLRAALCCLQLPALRKILWSGLGDEVADDFGFRDIKVVDAVLQLFA